MPTIGSVTKTIRFNPSDLGAVEAVMKKENTTFNNAVHILINGKSGVPQNKGDYEEIAEMASLMSVTTEKLLMDIRELLEEGSLYYSEGKLVNPRYEEFERACKGKNIDRILDSVVRSL